MDWLHRITGFEWDDGNARKSADKHKVGQSEAEQVFLNAPLLVYDDAEHSKDEPRFKALGHSNAGRLLLIVFTLRRDGSLIRIISARDMHKKERKYYEKESG